MKRRVVITGMGIMSSIGTNIKDFWSSCLDGKTVTQSIPEQWSKYADFNSKIWSPLPEIDFSKYGFSLVEQNKLDKASLLAMAATFEALTEAKLLYELKDEKRNTYIVNGINNDRAGVFIGTGVGGINTTINSNSYHFMANSKMKLKNLRTQLESKYNLDHHDRSLLEEIESMMLVAKRYNPFTVSMTMPNAPSANIGIKFNLSGPNNTLCSACASGTVAIGHGFVAVQNGLVDIAVVGGTEYLSDPYGTIFQGFDIVRTLTSRINQPFDQERSGFLFSEGGAGILVIEDLEHAQKRGATVLAEVLSFTESSDSYNIMMPDEFGEKIKLMLYKAMNDANLGPEQIDYINTHGTGTIANDLVESNVIGSIFGKKPMLNSTKSLLGHTLGASGAIEAIVSVLSILTNSIHPCKNLVNPISELNFVTETKTDCEINSVLTESFAFGGHNASIILKQYSQS